MKFYNFSFEKLYGLSNKWDNKFYQILAEVIDLTKPTEPLARILTQNLKMKSKIRSPVWEDACHQVLVPSLKNLVVVGKFQLDQEYRKNDK